MKLIILLSIVVGLVYTHPFPGNDNVDIGSAVAELANLQAYSNCLLDRGPCTPFTQSLKDKTQESVINACAKCNEPQKHGFGKFLSSLKANLPEDYQSFRQKYDPENIHFDALEAELSKF